MFDGGLFEFFLGRLGQISLDQFFNTDSDISVIRQGQPHQLRDDLGLNNFAEIVFRANPGISVRQILAKFAVCFILVSEAAHKPAASA